MLYHNFKTQEELDYQYDPTASGIDLSVHLNWYITRSAETRKELSHHLQVPYGPTRAEYLDIFPAAELNAPILVFIHGGYWVMNDTQPFSFVARGPVSAGITTIVLNYALCPKVTLDEIVRQTRAAVAWIYRNADSFGGNCDRIYVSGHSAGGHLTAMAMATDWENDYNLPQDIIKGGCAVSGLFDLMPFPYTWLQPKLQLTWGEVLRNSPIRHIPERAGSLIITYGGDETPEFARQSQDFLSAWQAKGLKGEYLPQRGKNHFSAIEGFIDVNNPLGAAILKQIQTSTNFDS